MHIRTIGKIHQISSVEWARLGYEHHQKHPGETPDYLHVVDPVDYENSDLLFADADRSLTGDTDGRLFYRTEQDAVTDVFDLVVDGFDFDNMLDEIARFIFGTSLQEVRFRPENFVGLPLWSLLAHTESGELFAPHLVPVLVTDFDNIAGDGTEKELVEHLRTCHNGKSLKILYTNIRAYIRSCAQSGGTFCFYYDI